MLGNCLVIELLVTSIGNLLVEKNLFGWKKNLFGYNNVRTQRTCEKYMEMNLVTTMSENLRKVYGNEVGG